MTSSIASTTRIKVGIAERKLQRNASGVAARQN